MKPCIVIPTYENPRTLADAVSGALGALDDVIVVDDGSGPETCEILARLAAEHSRVTVLTHERNRGKGAALRTGLDAARERGFSHAVSMDSDGQHLGGEVAKLLAAAREHPGAIILGQRDLVAAGAGPGSKIGRANSNFWTWVITGQRIPDTQTGFRCYPLEPLGELAFFCDSYDFEIEVLVRARWCDIPVVSIPIEVRYLPEGERVSHLRLGSYLRIAHLNTRFVTQKICLPPPYLRLRCSRRFHEQGFVARWKDTFRKFFVDEQGPPSRIAAAVGLGLFWGIAPVWGFQIILALLTAGWLRLSKPIAVVASHISFPLMIPPILYASLVTGRLTLGVRGDVAYPTQLTVERADLPAWIVGSLLLAVGAALVGGLLIYLLIRFARVFLRPRAKS